MRRLIAAVMTGAAAAAGFLMTPGAAWASATSSLSTGHTLRAGQSLVSPDGEYALTMRPDGNLVETARGGEVVFSTKTQGNPGAYLLAQHDGNLVIRAAKTNTALWASRHRSPDAGGAVLYDTGEFAQFYLNPSGFVSIVVPAAVLLLQAGQTLSAGQSLGQLSFNHLTIDVRMQTDGNLVSIAAGRTVWSARTAGHPGAFAVMQHDGNFVIYSAAGLPLWWTGTSGNPGARLVLQTSDDNLVLYSATDKALWSIHTGRIG